VADDLTFRLTSICQPRRHRENCVLCEAADEIDRLRAAGDELFAALNPQFAHIIPDDVEQAAHWEHREFALRAWEEARRG
jgi:hypothetical protein